MVDRKILRKFLLISCGLLLFLFAQLSSFVGRGPVQADAATISQNILTGVTLTDGSGNAFTQSNRVAPDSAAKIDYTWEITDTQSVNANDTFQFTLPSQFKMANSVSGNFADGSGTVYGSFTINTAGQVTMTFTKAVSQVADVKGTLEVATQFDVSGSPNQTITFSDKNHTQIPVYFEPNVSSTITKTGSLDKTLNPTQATWTVDVNKKLDTVNDAIVTESFPTGMTYSSVKVYNLNEQLDGSTSLGSQVTTGYSVDSNGNVTFSNPIDSAYELVYVSTINQNAKPSAGGSVSFTNKATFSGSVGGSSISYSASHTVSASFGRLLSKSSTGYDSSTQTFDWAIDYNYGNKTFDKPIITDTFGSTNVEYVPNSVKIYPVTFDSNGNPVVGSTALTSGYSVTPTSSGTTNGIKIAFSSASLSSAYQIQYQTQVKAGAYVDTNTKYTNTASTLDTDGTTTVTVTASRTAYQQDLQKSHGTPDYANKTIGWTLTVNGNHYAMNNWKLNDTFSNGGLTFVAGSLKVHDSTTNTDLTEGTDYTLDTSGNGSGSPGFVLNLIGSYATSETDSFTITYTTNYDTDYKLSQSNTSLKNTATGTWADVNNVTHTTTVSSTDTPNADTLNNGFKTGSYDLATKTISWQVGVNYDSEPVGSSPTLVDPFQGNQVFDAGSGVTLIPLVVNSDGTYTKGSSTTLTPSQYSYDSSTNTLTVDLPSNDTTPYLVEFTTSLVGQVIAKDYSNSAVWHSDNSSSSNNTLSYTVSIPDGGSLVTKTGYQQSGTRNVAWTINVNPSQSTLNNVTVTDNADDNQLFNQNSFAIYPATVNINGSLTPASTPLATSQYTLKFKTDNSGPRAKQSFTLTFPGTITQAYVVEYTSQINISGTSGTLSNDVSISGTNSTPYTGSGSKSVSVAIATGSGSGYGTSWGTLTIKKTGVGGTALAGAHFQLWSSDGTVLMGSGTTDSSGKVTFDNLTYDNYLLKETQAPAGYTISDALVSGVQIPFSSTKSTFAETDAQTKVTLTKEDASGSPLSGAVFTLEQETSGTYSPIRTGQTIKSGSSGTVEIDGLVPGNYRLIEKTAPTGYLINTTPIDFTVTQNSNNQIPDVNAGVLMDYQGSAKLVKTNATGTDLAGAVFKIADSKGNTVQSGLTSNNSGVIDATGLAPGTYDFVETQAPTGYVINTTEYGFTIPSSANGAPAVVSAGTALNYQGSVTLTKQNKAGTDLPGAVFKILDSKGAIVRQGLTSNASGVVTANGLAPGKYDFVETQAPSGYLLNTDDISFTIPASAKGMPVDVNAGTEVDYQGSAQLTKESMSGTDLPGAVFKIVDSKGNTVQQGLTSDSKGVVSVSALAPGTYDFVETEAPSGYILNTNQIGFTIPASAKDAPAVVDAGIAMNYQGSVQLTKEDANGTDLPGAVFKIIDSKGNTVQQGLTSGKSGVVSANGLAPGSYDFIETQAPTGYVLNTMEIGFTIDSAAAGEPATVNAGTAINYQGTVQLTKENADGADLAGAVFKIVNSNDVTVQQGLTSDSSGVITATGLKPGNYNFVETQAPTGYVMNTDEIAFSVPTSAKGMPMVVDAGTAVNYQGSVQLTKENVNGIDLAGAVFEIVDSQGTPVEEGLTSDKNGFVTATGLAPGNYDFVEVQAPAGYVLNTTPVSFTVPNSAAGQQTVNAGTDINYQGSVQLHKENEHGDSLSGATYKLVDATGNLVTDNLVTDVFGDLTVNNLAPGTYAFVEEKAPSGYLLSTKPISFTVDPSTSGQPSVVQVTATDQQDKVVVTQVSKHNHQLVLTGGKFKLVDKNGQPVTTDAFGVALPTLWTTNKEGQFTIANLPAGSYAFVEVDAPSGYILDTTPIAFTVNAGEASDVQVVAAKVIPDATDPVTGLPQRPWFTVGMGTILLGGFALWWSRRRREDKDS